MLAVGIYWPTHIINIAVKLSVALWFFVMEKCRSQGPWSGAGISWGSSHKSTLFISSKYQKIYVIKSSKNMNICIKISNYLYETYQFHIFSKKWTYLCKEYQFPQDKNVTDILADQVHIPKPSPSRLRRCFFSIPAGELVKARLILDILYIYIYNYIYMHVAGFRIDYIITYIYMP